MKIKAYLRISKKGRVVASRKPNYAPLYTDNYSRKSAQPTVAFAVIFDIPDEEFKRAEKALAEVLVKHENIDYSISVQQEDEELSTKPSSEVK